MILGCALRSGHQTSIFCMIFNHNPTVPSNDIYLIVGLSLSNKVIRVFVYNITRKYQDCLKILSTVLPRYNVVGGVHRIRAALY